MAVSASFVQRHLRRRRLKYTGVAVFDPAVHDADRLAPQACCSAMARLPAKRQRHDALIVNAQPRVTGRTPSARCGDGA
jgi:hypothetical protein